MWKKACVLAVRVYEMLKASTDYGLKDQMSRAAISIASNIAEGAERNSQKDFMRFLHIAKGSAGELRTQAYIACRIGHISQAQQEELVKELKSISKMLQSLVTSLKSKPNT